MMAVTTDGLRWEAGTQPDKRVPVAVEEEEVRLRSGDIAHPSSPRSIGTMGRGWSDAIAQIVPTFDRLCRRPLASRICDVRSICASWL